MKGKKIVVWFSCGAASAVAAKLTIMQYGRYNNVVIVNTPIKEEDDDNRRFLFDVQNWIGQPIFTAINKDYPNSSAVEVWRKVRYMSNRFGAPCTKLLKKEARYQWEFENHPDWHVLGFTSNEKHRHDRFVVTEIPNVIPILIEADFTKGDCFDIIKGAGIELPQSYRDGMPNANCNCCVKATSPTYWNLMRKKRPEAFKERAEQSRLLGVRLVRYKGKRIFLDELPEDAVGRPIKDMNFECGIFCEITN